MAARGGFEQRLADAADVAPVEYPVDVSSLSEPAWRMVRERGWIYRSVFDLWCWDVERVCDER